MAESAPDTVLKRKAEAGRAPAAGAPPTPGRAFGHAVAKVAQDMFGLPVRVMEAADLRASPADLPERLADRALLAILEGPGGGQGLVALSPEVLATLIEMQTTRRVGPAEVAARRPTRTDAAMSMRFIDRTMEELGLLLAADPAIGWAGGFRYGAFLDDPRPLGLMLEDGVYRVLRLALALGTEGARRGTILLAVPAAGRGPLPQPRPAGGKRDGVGDGGGDGGAAEAADWAGRMERAVMAAEVGVEAVLDRVSLPLSAVLALAPGSLVPLVRGATARVRIEGPDRRLLATGRLGQCQGSLAVRLAGAAGGDGAADAARGDTGCGPFSGAAPVPALAPAAIRAEAATPAAGDAAAAAGEIPAPASAPGPA